MKVGIPVFLSFVFVLSGCEKIKSFGEAGSSETVVPPVDPGLEKLVSREGDGVVFRKDLPFPASLNVETSVTVSGTLTGNADGLFGPGPGGKQSVSWKTVTLVEKIGGHVRYTTGQETPASAATPAPAQPKTILVFRRKAGKWKEDDASDFRAKSLALDLRKNFDDTLTGLGAAPKKFWFSQRVFRPGDELVLSGESLGILGPEYQKGSLSLRFEGTEAVEGHPCGVFRMKGDLSGKGNNGPWPGTAGIDMTIQDGKLWCSLLHPLVLREETDAVVTLRSSAGRVSGSLKTETRRGWKETAEHR